MAIPKGWQLKRGEEGRSIHVYDPSGKWRGRVFEIEDGGGPPHRFRDVYELLDAMLKEDEAPSTIDCGPLEDIHGVIAG